MSNNNTFEEITGTDSIGVYAIIIDGQVYGVSDDPAEALETLRSEHATTGKVVYVTAMVTDMETVWETESQEEER
jgi:hypothetical protein